MIQGEQISITIPRQIIDELASAIATGVVNRLESRIDRIASTKPVNLAFDDPRTRPTFLRIGEVSDRVRLARSTIYNKANKGSFPKSVKLSERTAAWRLEDIEVWERDPLGYGK